jgi:AcrR family transcriptional regulator
MSYRPTEKTEARKKAQHSLLLQSAMHIVAKNGFQGLTVAAVAERADVAIGTVYKYFDSKAALCTEVFHLGTEKEVQQVQLAAFPEEIGSSCKERLLSAVATFSERAIEGHRFAYALIAEPVDPMIEIERLNYRRAYADIFEELINEGVQAGEFCQQDTYISAAALVGTLAEALLGPIGSSRPDSLNFDRYELIRNIQNFCVRAVTN